MCFGALKPKGGATGEKTKAQLKPLLLPHTIEHNKATLDTMAPPCGQLKNYNGVVYQPVSGSPVISTKETFQQSH